MNGLPYGWWKNPEVWAILLSAFIIVGMATLLTGAWFLDWKW